jgi:glycosyltransferase involved in cell wall biosynthesis
LVDFSSDSDGLPAKATPTLVPRVSIIIPHYHSLPALDRCLNALGDQTYPSDRMEIIVADNASPEGEAAVADTIDGRASLVVVHERGAGPARNAGVTLATGEILAFTDSDCLPEPEWLAAGVAALATFDFVGGRMKVLVGHDDMTAVEAFERVFAFDNAAYVTRKGFSVTANLFCWRTVFDRVGGFRVGVSEDLDWCHRARAMGLRIGYAALAVVGHPARRTWPELTSKWTRLSAEAYALAAGRPGGRLRWLVRSCALPFSAVWHSGRVLSSNQLASPRQRVAALSVLYRLRIWRFAEALRLVTADR